MTSSSSPIKSPASSASRSALSPRARRILIGAPGESIEDRRAGNDKWDWADQQAIIHDAVRLKKKANLQLKKGRSVSKEEYLKARYEAGDYDIYDRLDKRIADIKFDQRLVTDRAKNGFQWSGGSFGGSATRHGAGSPYVCEPFVFRGLISDQHPILQLFVSKTHTAGYSTKKQRLKTGINKSEIQPMTRKVLGLDDPYVCWNAQMRGVIRVDIDRSFPGGVNELLHAIADCGVPAPNLVVGKIDLGKLSNPHLYWVLLDSVCWTLKGHRRPKMLFQTIEAALSCKLLPIGADYGGLNNSVRGKNPLCPNWDSFVVADAPFRLNRFAPHLGGDPFGLPILTEALGIGQDKAGDQVVDEAWALRRLACDPNDNIFDETGSGTEGPLASNKLFSVVRSRVSMLVRQFHPASLLAKDKRLAVDPAATAIHLRQRCERELEAALPSWAERANIPLSQIQTMALNSLEFMWANFDPSKLMVNKRQARGRLKAKCAGLSLSERQALGGKDVAARRRGMSLEALAKAYNGLVSQSIEISMAALAKAAGVSRSTAYAIGLVSIVTAAKELADAQISAAPKPSEKKTQQAQVLLLSSDCPTRCLVKRGNGVVFEGSSSNSNLGLNEGISTEFSYKISDPAAPKARTSQETTMMLRQREAYARVRTLLKARGTAQIQISMFPEIRDTLEVGAAMYHYLSAKTAGTITWKIRNRSFA
jgi:Replicase family